MVARAKKKNPGAFTIDAKIALGKVGETFALAVTLGGHFPDLPHSEAKELLES